MIDYSSMYELMMQSPLQSWAQTLKQQVDDGIYGSGHGDLDEWLAILKQLPDINPHSVQLNSSMIKVGDESGCDVDNREKLRLLLMQLRPWRKGPFELFGVRIDTEWRSDLKWERLKDHIEPLKDRLVLDVGCGSGYHCWRMSGEGAKLVIGIDTTLRYIMQFHAVQKYIKHPGVHVLPLNIDDMPEKLQGFDTVFSMGVLYHRRSPICHLYQLNSLLRPAGQLVLETLVIDDKHGDLLVPESRYAKMRNIWFIPSCGIIETWLKRSGFSNIRLVDVSQTSIDEQRGTDWMQFESLCDFLDPDDPDKTIEGHPAPRRALFIANKI